MLPFVVVALLGVLVPAQAMSINRVDVPHHRSKRWEEFPNATFTFDCADRPIGFYADLEFDCQIFHLCDGAGRRVPYMCDKMTAFNQKFRVCDWADKVDCQEAPKWYYLNDLTYEKAPSDDNDISIAPTDSKNKSKNKKAPTKEEEEIFDEQTLNKKADFNEEQEEIQDEQNLSKNLDSGEEVDILEEQTLNRRADIEEAFIAEEEKEDLDKQTLNERTDSIEEEEEEIIEEKTLNERADSFEEEEEVVLEEQPLNEGVDSIKEEEGDIVEE